MVVQSHRPPAPKDWTPMKNCELCGTAFEPRVPARGNPQRFCSGTCRERAGDKRSRSRNRLDRTIEIQNCKRCGNTFTQPQVGAPKKYCSQKCLLKTHYVARKQIYETKACSLCASIYLAQIDEKSPYCSKRCRGFVREKWPRSVKRKTSEVRPDGLTCDECTKPLWASGKCASHYNTKIRRISGERYPSNHRDRARWWGVEYRAFNIRKMFEESNWICGICLEPVDPNTDDPRWRASVDHIIPMSRGGAHVRENCQLAHVSCNSKKRDTLGTPSPMSP